MGCNKNRNEGKILGADYTIEMGYYAINYETSF